MGDRTLTKSSLLELIRTEQASLDALLGELTEEQLVQPGVEGAWSPKDVAAHLAFWEGLVADELAEVAQGKTPPAIDADETQRLNERNAQNNLDSTPAEVRAGVERSNRALLENVSRLGDEVLAGPCTWSAEATIAAHVASEMRHWRDHMARVRQWLAGGGASQPRA